MTFSEDYRVQYTYSSRNDMRGMKQYILRKFCYVELGENFTRKMKKVARELALSPMGHKDTGFIYRGYIVYVKSRGSYLFFYIVNHRTKIVSVLRIMQDGMNWKDKLENWLERNK